MPSKQDYAKMVKEAQEAVESLKDAELKGIAFGRILETLLGQQAEAPDAEKPTRKLRGKRTTPPGKKKTGPTGQIEQLIQEGFFRNPKTLAAVKAELANRGHHLPLTTLSPTMMALCQKRRLRRQKVTDGQKSVFKYSNWS